MSDNPKPNPAFQLGICMAGAVSAGAYTAGVMDYLLEALTTYEEKRGKDGFPSHKVEIPVMGGASAGGMTAIITAAALQQGITPITTPLSDPQEERPENILYHSWVDLTARDMFSKMLDNGDIGTDVVSALNCQFIDEVAQRAIRPAGTVKWQEMPAFFPGKLKLFTTLSNLEGFTYDIAFKSAEPSSFHPYYMQLHNDYACFELLRPGEQPTSDGWMPLNINSGENTRAAMDAAMATGAFPVGLRSRIVSRTENTANNNPLYDNKTLKAIKIDRDPYNSLNVDGGMINNEPFDKVRELLMDITDQREQDAYESYDTFKSTVLMIAPFPSTKPQAISLGDKLLHVVGLTLSAMISQMRAKASQIKDAMNPTCAGQYLIDPSRTIHKNTPEQKTIQGERAIACGALGGFSGFLNKEFRVHDYFLGRYNCQVFLQQYFTISAASLSINPIFKEGYAGVKDLSPFTAKDGGIQIIPVGNQPLAMPDINFSGGNKKWPEQSWDNIEQYSDALEQRIQKVIMNVTTYNPVAKFFLGIGTFILLRGMLAKAALKTVKQELTKWHLIKGAEPEAVKDPKTFPVVIFNSTVTGNFRYLDLTINGEPVPVTKTGISYQQHLDHPVLMVVYHFSGSPGDFIINYNCSKDGIIKSDKNNPPGIHGKIGPEGHHKFTLEIPLS
ncbi:patatin-like phospholipase family protein [Mucilaginibacter sp. OK098]|uniref:patatin-like phospholipase family protein n=1 Tax=Mucilaginibacter sp. OK098 TaxID=1855297 RepID=UPI0009242031|nr:patatin-like phospholipase family protein [Mucilaginibacter sp. OK098]SHM80686.1 Patatin-like phospholipase [Mucilaginibacter sp. OK098]